MSLQAKAGFRKEILALFRTKTFLILTLVIIGLSALNPLLMFAMRPIINAMGMADGFTDTSSTGVSASVGEITSTGLIVFLLLINRAAGGEQKKRTVIIPKCSGLRSFGYVFPKYIVYPLFALALVIVAMFVSWGISALIFGYNDVTFFDVLLAAVLGGVSMMLYICFHLTLGTATGKAGMSAAVCIGASIILPSIFALMSSDYMFNPFALENLASTVIWRPYISGGEMRDIFVTIAFALALMVLSYLIALFVQNAKKIDNSGDEIEL